MKFLIMFAVILSPRYDLIAQAQIDYSSDPAPQSMGCLLIDPDNVDFHSSYVSAQECITLNPEEQEELIIEHPILYTIEAGKEINVKKKTMLKDETHLRIREPLMSLVWYAPNNAGVANHYEKMEVGLGLSSHYMAEIERFFNVNDGFDGMNPYNRHDFDIQMTFFHEGTPVDRVDAFYYVPQKIVGNQMVDDTTSYPFRFRHSPRFLGNYRAEVDLIINDLLVTRMQFDFQVVPSDNKGYLEKGKYQYHLRTAKDKESFFGVGQNIPWTEWPDWGDWHKKADFQRLHNELGSPFETFANARGNFSRVVGAEWSLQMEVEALGNYKSRMDHAWYLDKLADFCSDEEIFFIYCMRAHHELSMEPNTVNGQDIFNQAGWNHCPYNDNAPIPVNAHEPSIGITDGADFYTNETAKDHYKNFMRYIVSRYGYASSIAGWQMMSEINVTGRYEHGTPTNVDAPHRVAIHNWIDEMAAFLDTVQFDRHLTSVAIVGDDRTLLDQAHHMGVFESKYIDFTGIHTYSTQQIDIYSNHKDTFDGGIFRNRNLLAIYQAARNITTGSNGQQALPPMAYQFKPFIFDEYGLSPYSGQDTQASPPLDIVKEFNKCNQHAFHNDLWASMCSGSATTGLDWWQHNDPVRHQMWSDEFFGIKEFFKDINFETVNYNKKYYKWNSNNEMGLYAAQRWPWKREDIRATNVNVSPSKQYSSDDAIEGLTMISDDKKQGFGWAHNRSHYWHNLMEELPCMKAMIQGLVPWTTNVIIRPRDDDHIDTYRDVELNSDFIKVRKLKKGKRYIIRYYHPQTNQLIDEKVRWSTLTGKLKIKIGALSTVHQDVAYKFIRFNADWKSASTDSSSMTDTIGAAIKQVDGVVVYPNPNSGRFVVKSVKSLLRTVIVIDPKGKQVLLEKEIKKREFNINLDLGEGVYFVKITLENGETMTEKIVVKHE